MPIDIPGARAARPLPAQLSDLNKLRLLTGYHSLILSWTRISTTPLPLVGCGMGTANHHETAASVRGDLVKNMEALQSCRASTCSVAINVATRGLPKLIKKIEASMDDHFLGPEGQAPVNSMQSIYCSGEYDPSVLAMTEFPSYNFILSSPLTSEERSNSLHEAPLQFKSSRKAPGAFKAPQAHLEGSTQNAVRAGNIMNELLPDFGPHLEKPELLTLRNRLS
ncbi:hypothetical protein B0H13DRAFT_2349024 [Mycena leptocephala]|nr:hypothetical protein B0H13DRAFT_2349024 [Mycena leptocephala]